MDRIIELYIENRKIGNIPHEFLYDDELNSGREICKGCLLVLNDFKYRVAKVTNTENGFIAHLIKIQ